MTDHAHDTDAADRRRARWSELPAPVAYEETRASQDATVQAPDLVADPEHEFMIRHA